jgi:hypothetical protein
VRSCAGHARRGSGLNPPFIAGFAQSVNYAHGHIGSLLASEFDLRQSRVSAEGHVAHFHRHILEENVWLLFQVLLDGLLNCPFRINSTEFVASRRRNHTQDYKTNYHRAHWDLPCLDQA